ncbi:sulfotransferase [Wenxinia marina]|uniref:Sulfotransferase family n=1 Tax=Wenxinia marina DSM 24838 TaxID=1123501 RepID=A0A0D0PER5_9RHOB|nr:sulfotransferase [Wenxinia marina]KIQ69891.1 Sulfotransferase family [Wenxinia marina DSM 24838]GGL62029.1 hypothetical protein GCM10011392_15640 [Wenxinia marina]
MSGAGPSPAPTLVFGVGATKAGTSWLYRFLAQHPECHLRSIKELHFFDALEKGGDFQLTQQRRRARSLSRRLDEVGAAAPEAPRLRRQLTDVEAYAQVLAAGDTDGYLRYLTEGRRDRSVIADVTPAYALLPEERLGQMARLAPVTRFVYLMRDPVSRLWSHVRMLAARAVKKDGGEMETAAARIFDRVERGQQPDVTRRGDYADCLTRLDRAVPRDALWTGFYETLFTPQSVAAICAFLGIAPAEGRYDRRVHEGAPLRMTDDQRARAARLLAPQYDFARARMGRLPPQWDANLEAVG